MSSFSDTTRELLQQAGWFEDRKVDTHKYEEVLRQEGFLVHPAAIAFLQRFGGLHIICPNHRSPSTTNCHFFGVDLLPPDVIDPEVMQEHMSRVGAPLCYIGEAGNEFLSLLMTPAGKVYAMNDDWLAWVADSGCDAIEALCTGRELQDVLETRHSWPAHDLLSQCIIDPPTGWLDRVTASPRQDVAAVRWMEQDEAGFLLVALRETGDQPLPDHVYRTEPNLIMGPTFSPDGAFLVLTCGRSFWWAGDEEEIDSPAQGGVYEVGHVTIYGVDTGRVREIPVEIEVPPGWLPDDPESMESEFLGEPQFINATDFNVRLPNGATATFTTTAAV